MYGIRTGMDSGTCRLLSEDVRECDVERFAESGLYIQSVDIKQSPVASYPQLQELPPYSGTDTPKHVESLEAGIGIVYTFLCGYILTHELT